MNNEKFENTTIDEDTELSLNLFIVFARSYREIAELVRRDIQNYNLNPTEFGVLELLYHKGPQPLQHIGKRILLASGSITYVVDKLEEKGLLNRKNCLKDRRVIYAEISEQGKRLMEEIFPKHREALKKIFSGIDVEEKRLAIALLKKIGFYANNLDSQ
ncbi:transcriptional regulator [Vulcanibacillus modesticaldus]|uniref:Transcriptional regulator n=1 Tax=Vulcanibacillus modesticaldus TaxID=337097 RepID=A0A1D2YWA9_9BACI|nr:MarR family transcriptional regulator [Vulcanibacillus modesticaldus]OEF99989.1 transcriptional regulator [Vulcanibacillus modesticaldus]